MKQKIKVPGKLTPTLFNLPPIISAHKRQGKLAFYMLDLKIITGPWQFLMPGDFLIEEDDGSWTVERKVFSKKKDEQ